MRHKIALCTLAALTLCFGFSPSQAQVQNSPYDSSGEPFTSKYFKRTPCSVSMSLQRRDDLPTGFFVMHITAAEEVSSCAKYGKMEDHLEFKEKLLDISIGDYTVDMRDLPQYAHYQCDTKPQQPYTDIVLNKDVLREKKIERMRFRMATGTETYNVKINDNSILLTPEMAKPAACLKCKPAQVANSSNPLRFWFYPEGTVILSADNAGKDLVLSEQIKTLAESRGLVPLTSVMPHHVPPRSTQDALYFIDKKGEFSEAKGELLDYVQVDTMKFGLEADEPAKKDVGVFIRKPGQYD